jgi:hypothetical protein
MKSGKIFLMIRRKTVSRFDFFVNDEMRVGKITTEISFLLAKFSLQNCSMNFTFHGLGVSAHGS